MIFQMNQGITKEENFLRINLVMPKKKKWNAI